MANELQHATVGTSLTQSEYEAITGHIVGSQAIGDVIYASSTTVLSALRGNTSTTKKYLSQTGSGSASAAPAWGAIADGDLPSTIARDSELHTQGHVLDGGTHTVSGLTAGHLVRATGSTTYAFGALADGDIPSTIARDSELHTAAHAIEGGNHTGGPVAIAMGGTALAANPKDALMIVASSLKGTTTNPAGDTDGLPESAESSTNKVNYDYMAFDTSTEQNAFVEFPFPKAWDEGTITFRAYWTNTGGASSETVVWGVKGVALSNDAAIDTAWGTEVTVSDTWIAQNDLHITSDSAAITIGNSPAEGDLVMLNIARKTGSDDMAGDARLIAVAFEFTRSSYTE